MYKCVKLMCYDPKNDLVLIHAYKKFGEILSNCSQAIEQKQNFGKIKGYNSDKNVPKLMCNDPKLDLVNWNAYIKSGEILYIGPQDIEWK